MNGVQNVHFECPRNSSNIEVESHKSQGGNGTIIITFIGGVFVQKKKKTSFQFRKLYSMKIFEREFIAIYVCGDSFKYAHR